jgi:hypothetical protein
MKVTIEVKEGKRVEVPEDGLSYQLTPKNHPPITPNSRDKVHNSRQPNWERLFAAIFSGFLMVGSGGFIIYLIETSKETGEWRERTATRIENLEKSCGQSDTNEGLAKQANEDLKTVDCYIGLMEAEYPDTKRSIFDRKYETSEKICEFNTAYDNWDTIGLPSDSDFIEIVNNRNTLRTWALVIGYFHDENYPKRALVVSQKAGSCLFSGEYRRGISMRIRLMTREEVFTDNDRIRLLKEYEIKY